MNEDPNWRKHLRHDEPKQVAALELEIAANRDKAVIGQARLAVIKRRASQRAFRAAKTLNSLSTEQA